MEQNRDTQDKINFEKYKVLVDRVIRDAEESSIVISELYQEIVKLKIEIERMRVLFTIISACSTIFLSVVLSFIFSYFKK